MHVCWHQISAKEATEVESSLLPRGRFSDSLKESKNRPLILSLCLDTCRDKYPVFRGLSLLYSKLY